MSLPLVTPEEAVRCVRSGDRVFVHGGAAVPRRLIAALADRASELEDVEIVHIHIEGDLPYVAPGMERHFRHRALFIGASTRAAVAEGRADYVPVLLSDIPNLFRIGRLRIDVALVNLSWPDAHGCTSLGTSVDIAHAAVSSARLVVAQLNHSMPRTLGDSIVPVDRLAAAVEADELPYEVTPKPPTEVERQIAAHVTELIPDGATIQMGIGGIPNAVLGFLQSKRSIGVHTEMFSDGLLPLVESGVVNGRKKELNTGKIVTSFVIGTRRLYDFVHDNPLVEMHPTDYTNDTAVIRRFSRLVAINSALEVDLTGQVVADQIGGRPYSGVGGQMDFMRGAAALAEHGRPIIAMPSTAKNGTISRIVATLTPGSAVVTPRAHVHFVVTEYGVAYLHGKSLRERAQALIRIAHPAFRDELTAAARQQRLI